MSDLQARLTQLAIENSEDLETITRAKARIDARERDIQLLKAQILVDKCLQSGFLPKSSFNRLRKDVALRSVEAMECQLCEHKPDDAQLSACGHIYCDECWSKVWPGRCKHRSCGRRIKRGAEIDNTLFEAICLMLKISFDEEDEDSEDDSDDGSALLASRSSRPGGGSVEYASPTSSRLRSQLFESYNSAVDEQSEGDGFDDHSQRSMGYGDDASSFVSDDESIDMTADFHFREDETPSESSEGDVSMGSEED